MLSQRPIDLSVFDVCVNAFEHVIPALRFWAKQHPEEMFPPVAPFQTICSYGPPLFAHDAIEAMISHINSSRYLNRPEFPFVEMTGDVQKREIDAVTLWSWIETNPGGLEQALWHQTGVAQRTGVAILNSWVELGAVRRTPYEDSWNLSFASDLSAQVIGMCPNCGLRGKARREVLYGPIACQRCGVETFYHLLNVL